MTDDSYESADPDNDDWELVDPDPDHWIVVNNWQRFQHYRDRQPSWIKNYTLLLNDPDYLALTPAARGLLHGIWLAYAVRNGALRVRQLKQCLRTRVSYVQLTSLNHAGFIGFCASKPLAFTRARERAREETEKEKETPQTPRYKKELERQLLHRALEVVADWQGRLSSDKFASKIAELEREHHATLSVAQREALWDEALRREQAGRNHEPDIPF